MIFHYFCFWCFFFYDFRYFGYSTGRKQAAMQSRYKIISIKPIHNVLPFLGFCKIYNWLGYWSGLLVENMIRRGRISSNAFQTSYLWKAKSIWNYGRNIPVTRFHIAAAALFFFCCQHIRSHAMSFKGRFIPVLRAEGNQLFLTFFSGKCKCVLFLQITYTRERLFDCVEIYIKWHSGKYLLWPKINTPFNWIGPYTIMLIIMLLYGELDGYWT